MSVIIHHSFCRCYQLWRYSIEEQRHTIPTSQQKNVNNNAKNIRHQQEKSSIMTEESYNSVKHLINSYEYIVDGDPCIINKLEAYAGLAENAKRLKDISYYHRRNQYSTIETLNLEKYKFVQKLVVRIQFDIYFLYYCQCRYLCWWTNNSRGSGMAHAFSGFYLRFLSGFDNRLSG